MAEEKREVLNPSERNIRWFLASLGLGCFASLVMLEIVTQRGDQSLPDLLVDAASILLTIVAAVGVALLAQRMHVQHEERMALIRDLEVARAESNGWRAKVRSHLAGLKAGLDQQFHDWGMTAAEREVGLLILKGLSHKEKAALRATTEATVRQQAQAIYARPTCRARPLFPPTSWRISSRPSYGERAFHAACPEDRRALARQDGPVGRAALEPFSSDA